MNTIRLQYSTFTKPNLPYFTLPKTRSNSQFRLYSQKAHQENFDSTKCGIVGLLSALGSLETGYLTYSHFTDSTTFCPSWSSCSSVLNSDYAVFFGVPLSALGFLTYSTLLGFSITGFINENMVMKRWNFVQQGVVGCSVVLVSCCIVLMYILTTRMENPLCLWCLLSVFLSINIGATVWLGLDRRELREAMIPSMGLASTVVMSMSLWLSWVDTSSAEVEIPFQPNDITTQSSQEGISLAKKLKKNGSKMYGAFWCSHCFEQKQLFGQPAVQDLPYVECYPNGYRKGERMSDECMLANLQGFPTWVINGKEIEGEQTFEQLSKALDGMYDDDAGQQGN